MSEDTPNSIKIDVFGRLVLAVKSEHGWRMYYLGEDGKRRPADDLILPPSLATDELVSYLADLCHEWATEKHNDVRRLD